MRRALQLYASAGFRTFFQLQSRRAVSDAARLKDTVVHMDGLAADQQAALLRLVGNTESGEQPRPYDETTELYRRHNSSLMRLEGQCVYGKVGVLQASVNEGAGGRTCCRSSMLRSKRLKRLSKK